MNIETAIEQIEDSKYVLTIEGDDYRGIASPDLETDEDGVSDERHDSPFPFITEGNISDEDASQEFAEQFESDIDSAMEYISDNGIESLMEEDPQDVIEYDDV